VTIEPGLTGVAETALWTLWYRAAETRRRDAMLSDPVAVDVLNKIDFPYTERFGHIFPGQLVAMSLRVTGFDAQVRRFLDRHPDGTVVALGEGMETQFWRVDNGRVRWVTVDLPESIALRRRLMPGNDRMRSFGGSALDPSWMDLVEPPVLITAQGLLMYLAPADVHRLLAMCARRFPGGAIVFDAVPPWMARLVSRGTTGYKPPPLRWTLTPATLPDLSTVDPAIASVSEVHLPGGRGLLGRVLPKWYRVPVLCRLRPLMVRLEFSGQRD
jgi:O-methyltransferase involved in polyketide biosynthesis